MAQRFGIVDLFAGPGGLSEGFSSIGEDACVRLSVEQDPHAVRTLHLRSLLRQFPEGYPKAYYQALAEYDTDNQTDLILSTMMNAFPREWRTAEDEVLQLTLGKPGSFEFLKKFLDAIRETYHGDTILIGGPPCQAYSIVGRSRNKGKRDYIPEQDDRHYLYREYVRILEYLRPACFVMENVKGLLSSRVDGGAIFQRILDDLQSAARPDGGYKLSCVAVPQSKDGEKIRASDYLVRAENFGIPQQRHRIFIIGVRSDRANRSSSVSLGLESRQSVSLGDVLSALPTLRSGLSRNDSNECWEKSIRSQLSILSRALDIQQDIVRASLDDIHNGLEAQLPRVSTIYPCSKTDIGGELGAWLRDERLQCLPQHRTRGHIPADLGRYGYAALFAKLHGRSPKLTEFPVQLQPKHRNRETGKFSDRFRVQLADEPSKTITSHISKDGHYYIHPDPAQFRSLTVREAARLQTFPDNYLFCGPRTEQYKQVGNAVPPFLARQIALALTTQLRD